ncbi:hypothetical protein JCM21900_000640 [Sporobolomyces salmonicolor]
MRLEYFAATCEAAATTAAATIGCVAKEGTCCGVCADTLASLGTRRGLTFTVFFATTVVVIDGAEAPFIFMTTCLPALAYILTVLQQGVWRQGTSKFHVYYALFSSLGFLCPLSAVSLTAIISVMAARIQRGARQRSHHSLHPSSQLRNSLPKPLHYSHTLQLPRQHFLFRSLGVSPFFSSTARGATRGTGTGNLRRPLASTEPFKHYEGTDSDYSPVLQGKQPSRVVPAIEWMRSPRWATPGRRIQRVMKGGAWRRDGMLASNIALWVLWLFAFLLTRQVVGHFKLLQTNCKDPDGTRLLNVATIVLLAVGVFVFVAFLCNYFTQWLHKHRRRLFDYNRSGDRWTRLMLPAVMSGLIYAPWLAFLWTAYELAAQPNSSLLAATLRSHEETATFPTVLSIALCIRPVANVVKELTKIHKRKCREKKDAARQTAASREPDPPRSVVEAQTSFAPLSEPKPDPILGNRTASAPGAHGRRAPSLREVDERVERRRRRRHESEADSDRKPRGGG